MAHPAARVVAFYLPQFHPIPENDAWWGAGFTEWTNVRKAKPLFEGHEQPRMPTELGYYDLRDPAVRAAQARLAREHGIEAFCYYHYWFGGRRILERPFAEVLASGQPDFPFCLCWANQSWTGVWHGAPDRVLIEQTYPGEDDHVAHFEALLPAFADPRYLKVEGRPVFVVYAPGGIPRMRDAFALWRRLAAASGLAGLYLVGCTYVPDVKPPIEYGLDAFVATLLPKIRAAGAGGGPTVYPYSMVARRLVLAPTPGVARFPCAVPNWDNTPRSGTRGLVLRGSTPGIFALHAAAALRSVNALPAAQRLVFVKSWNEWAEGNYLEPDERHGRGYLEALRGALDAAGAPAPAGPA
jgi:lipopolysaccharide biosynthesis protein